MALHIASPCRHPRPLAVGLLRSRNLKANVLRPGVQLVRAGKAAPTNTAEADGPSTDLSVIARRLTKLALPYWTTSDVAVSARWKLAAVVALTLATTGVSVMFNFLGRDFFNALSEKKADEFTVQLFRYLGGFVIGIPFFVYRSYYQSKLALEWREWTTEQFLTQYLGDRTFYQLQAGQVVDNPDQRVSSDIRNFTESAVNLSLTMLIAILDLVSFSGILYSIYPPLFGALIAYSVGGTVISIALGKNLVTLNFNQEAREADFRYGLVRIRENAEGIAFYGGEKDEQALLTERLKAAVANYLGLLVASRNLDFFTSFYRYMIQLLPAAVVAPLFFSGKIEFGVINQSQSAFNHVLNDLSLVVYQFESLAGFSAVVDRLGEFQEAMIQQRTISNNSSANSTTGWANIPGGSALGLLAAGKPQLQATSEPPITTQDSAAVTPAAISPAAVAAAISPGGLFSASDSDSNLRGDEQSVDRIKLLYLPSHSTSNGHSNGSSNGAAHVVGRSSGSANSSRQPLLELQDVAVITPRGGIATPLVEGLSIQVQASRPLLIMGPSGAGKTSVLRALAGLWSNGRGSIRVYTPPEELMFLPQKPYMVLGSLREQVLYPRCIREGGSSDSSTGSSSSNAVQLSNTSSRNDNNGNGSNGSGSPASAIGTASSSQGMVRSDAEILKVLQTVQLGHLLTRYATGANSTTTDISSSSTNGHASAPATAGTSTPSSSSALDTVVDWSGSLSLGEQQRLAWARLLLARPTLALLDEATSALDQDTEAALYKVLANSGITYVSVGHRGTLKAFHEQLLQLKPQAQTSVMSWEVLQLEGLKQREESTVSVAAAY